MIFFWPSFAFVLLSPKKKSSSKTYKSAIFAAVHENMADLYESGAIDVRTMRAFDNACLTPVMNITPAVIKRLRKKEAVSQAVLAAHLNVTTGIVSKWERGEKKPRGSAAKLLTLAAKNGIASIA